MHNFCRGNRGGVRVRERAFPGSPVAALDSIAKQNTTKTSPCFVFLSENCCWACLCHEVSPLDYFFFGGGEGDLVPVPGIFDPRVAECKVFPLQRSLCKSYAEIVNISFFSVPDLKLKGLTWTPWFCAFLFPHPDSVHFCSLTLTVCVSVPPP